MTQQKLDTQRDVVKNERRWSMDNQPYGTWWERLPALCFPPEHPFHHSLIGSMDDLDAASLDDVAHFFATYYTPDNAVLSIAGDFDAARRAATRREALRRAFRAGAGKPPLPDMALPPTFGAVEARSGAGRRDAAATLSRVSLAGVRHASSTTRRACAARARPAKGKPAPARLVRERQVAAEAPAFTYDLVEGQRPARRRRHGAPGIGAEQLEQEVADEIDACVRDGVTEDEVERAVALIETDFVVALQSAGDAPTASRCSRRTSEIPNW